jgi:hypothetical protein
MSRFPTIAWLGVESVNNSGREGLIRGSTATNGLRSRRVGTIVGGRHGIRDPARNQGPRDTRAAFATHELAPIGAPRRQIGIELEVSASGGDDRPKSGWNGTQVGRRPTEPGPRVLPPAAAQLREELAGAFLVGKRPAD